jgi:hypothetical protein
VEFAPYIDDGAVDRLLARRGGIPAERVIRQPWSVG